MSTVWENPALDLGYPSQLFPSRTSDRIFSTTLLRRLIPSCHFWARLGVQFIQSTSCEKQTLKNESNDHNSGKFIYDSFVNAILMVVINGSTTPQTPQFNSSLNVARPSGSHKSRHVCYHVSICKCFYGPLAAGHGWWMCEWNRWTWFIAGDSWTVEKLGANYNHGNGVVSRILLTAFKWDNRWLNLNFIRQVTRKDRRDSFRLVWERWRFYRKRIFYVMYLIFTISKCWLFLMIHSLSFVV